LSPEQVCLTICEAFLTNPHQARLSGETMAELEELQEAPEDTFIAKTVNYIKRTALSALGRFGFFGILLFASVCSCLPAFFLFSLAEKESKKKKDSKPPLRFGWHHVRTLFGSLLDIFWCHSHWQVLHQGSHTGPSLSLFFLSFPFLLSTHPLKQTAFVITMFSQQLLTYMIEQIEYIFPFTSGMIQDFLEKEKMKLHRVGGAVHTASEVHNVPFSFH
jgi:hypothetical protein